MLIPHPLAPPSGAPIPETRLWIPSHHPANGFDSESESGDQYLSGIDSDSESGIIEND